MPRCCASINQPSGSTNVVVYVQVDAADEATAQAAAQQAALAAFHAGGFAGAPPQVDLETKPGKIAK
jgi:hypothetical protein